MIFIPFHQFLTTFPKFPSNMLWCFFSFPDPAGIPPISWVRFSLICMVFPWFPVFLHGFQPWKNQGRAVPNGPVPRHGVLLSDAGIAFTWGDNRYGQLGRAPVLKEENGRCLPGGHPWWLDDLVPPWLLKAPDMGLFWEMRTSINGEFTGFDGDLPSSKLRKLWKMAYL